MEQKRYLHRYIVLACLLAVVFVAIVLRLYSMQVVQHDEYVTQAESKKTKQIILTGMRGTIYDKNMTPLAYDERSYNVQFYRDPSKSSAADRAAYTDVIIATIELIESNGKGTINEFWLEKDETTGKWHFNTGAASPAADQKRQTQWRENFFLRSTETYPEDTLFDRLCENYAIPANLSDAMKVKVLAVWQASRMNAYNSQPVTIAYDVGFETVSEIEVRANDLDGVSISESSTRVYPQGTLAAHAIGYTSKISGSASLEEYLAKGYSTDALVGATGIEYSMEDQLTPYIEYRQGKRTVEIDTRGKVVRETDYTAPVDGNSVVLTIDTGRQRVMEQAREETSDTIRADQEVIISGVDSTGERWNRVNAETLATYAAEDRAVSTAATGAIVAMNPNTGEVLGIASYPSYDLSIFEGATVDAGAWSEIAMDERNPMFNRAISAKDTPGSVFKLVTALGGLSEGVLGLDEQISDMGEYSNEGTDTSYHPKCWASASIRESLHQNQTIIEAIKNSCNYFFYEVGYRLGSTNLTKWAAALGLTSKTNIELPSESTSFVGNQNVLYDASRDAEDQYTYKPMIAAVMIRKMIRQVASDRGIEYTDDEIEAAVKKLLDITISYDTKAEWNRPIREVLQYDLHIPVSYIASHLLGNTIVTYLNDLRWTPSETIMCAIGQSITQITPIAAARYVAAIANGGTVYDAQIIDRIIAADGTVVLEKEPVVANRINSDPAFFAAIRKGMEEVTSTENDGTAAAQFAKAKYPIAAKTGTSQRTDLDIENNAWLLTYAPFENPQIVVVVYIQNGYAGARSSQAAISTIEYYLDSQGYSETNVVSDDNDLAN